MSVTLDILEIYDHKNLLHQTIYHINNWKTEHLFAKHICHHIHNGVVPKNLNRVHEDDEDTPLLSIPFEVTWKETWLT